MMPEDNFEYWYKQGTEFFDLEKDPGETKNLINDSNYQSTISKMRTLAEKRFHEIRVTDSAVISTEPK